MNSTERFGQRADAYAKHRPGYPDEALGVLFAGMDARSGVVADVGAGTGISSAFLAPHVAQVIAIEPNAAMRERALTATNVQWCEGTGEQTGLPDKSVDLAAAFQAFHWFEAARAFREFERIARRRIALVQYERDESAPFSAAYAALIRPYMLDDTEALRLRALEEFARLAGSRLRRARISFVQTFDAAGVTGRIDSSSYLPREGDAAAQLRAAAAALFERFVRDGRVDMAMTLHVLCADVA